VVLLLALTLLPLAASSPPSPAHKPRVVVLDVQGAALSSDEKGTVAALVAAQTARSVDADVLSASDLRTMLDLAAQKQAEGCDTTSCLVEVANALDARAVVSTEVGRLGALVVVNLALFEPTQARVIARAQARGDTTEQLAAQLTPAVQSLWRGVTLTAGGVDKQAQVPWGSIAVVTAGALGVVGGAVGVGYAAVAYGDAADKAAHLDTLGHALPASPSPSEVDALKTAHAASLSADDTFNTAGLAAGSVGAALVVVGLAACGWAAVSLASEGE